MSGITQQYLDRCSSLSRMSNFGPPIAHFPPSKLTPETIKNAEYSYHSDSSYYGHEVQQKMSTITTHYAHQGSFSGSGSVSGSYSGRFTNFAGSQGQWQRPSVMGLFGN
ncbi:hypothetical protein GQ42DRAFT_164320 [Ramicandelaber brevisporus]|nr:hypothetical protein GQ42DRAFT_164320 [Ramicandelaber brevisporus]